MFFWTIRTTLCLHGHMQLSLHMEARNQYSDLFRGYCIAKWWWWQSRLHTAEAEYGFSATQSVKKRKVYPDSDVDDEAHALIEGLNA